MLINDIMYTSAASPVAPIYVANTLGSRFPVKLGGPTLMFLIMSETWRWADPQLGVEKIHCHAIKSQMWQARVSNTWTRKRMKQVWRCFDVYVYIQFYTSTGCGRETGDYKIIINSNPVFIKL